jgi:hypothetical protein
MCEFLFYLIAALAAILTLAQAFQVLENRIDERKQTEQGDQTGGDSNQPTKGMNEEIRPRRSPGINGSSREEEHRTKEREHWRRLIHTACALNWITLVGAVTGLGGLFFLWSTLQVSITAADSAKLAAQAAKVQVLQMQEDRRAWISPDAVTLAKPPAIGEGLAINVGFTNTGPSPALDTWMLTFPAVFTADEWDSNNGIAQRWVDTMRNTFFQMPSDTGPPISLTVYPGTNHSYSFSHNTKTDGLLVDNEIITGKRFLFL